MATDPWAVVSQTPATDEWSAVSVKPSGPTPLQRAGQFIQRQGQQMIAPIVKDVREDLAYQQQKPSLERFGKSFTQPFEAGGALRGFKEVGDVYSGLTLPLAKAESKVFDPVKKATGIDLGLALSAMGPELGGLNAAKATALGLPTAATMSEGEAAASNALKSLTGKVFGSTDDAKHLAAVDKLKKAGVELTPGHELGGEARRTEQAQKSNRLVGGAIRKRENRAVETFNEATFRKTLEAAGETYDSSMKAGRDGLAAVEAKLSNKYNQVLNAEVDGQPKVRFVADEEFDNHIAGIERSLGRAKAGTKEQFRNILNDLVIDRLEGNQFAGRSFKDIETDLNYEANLNRKSQDPNDNRLASAIDDLISGLQDGMERHSDPSVKAELQQANTGWAMFSRLRAAATRRATSGGVFSAGDLLQAAKMGDRSAKKSAFMRGDALFQDFAEDAYTVLKNDLPDSGTAERLDRLGALGAGIGGFVGGIPGAIVGYMGERATGMGTNALAEYAMAKRAREQITGIAPKPPGALNNLRNVTPYGAGAQQAAFVSQNMQQPQ